MPISRTARAIWSAVPIVLAACGTGDDLTATATTDLRDSVVEVSAIGCGDGIAFGVGFMVEPGLVVTAAHVVAGSERVSTTTTNRARSSAVVVALDPAADVAVLSVDHLLVPLDLTDDPESVEVVVVDRDGVAVESEIENEVIMRIPDIYMGDLVDRPALQLTESFSAGMSGAPVIDSDGDVAGIVVAASADHSYAVIASQIEDVVDDADGTRVDTGACAVIEAYACSILPTSSAADHSCSRTL